MISRRNVFFWLKIILGVGIVFLFLLLFLRLRNNFSDLRSFSDHSIIAWQLENQPLKVELVNTPASITQGLSGRTGLDGIDGMLFVFDQPAIRNFWMKGMAMPIDIIWLYQGKVVGIERNVQPPPEGTTDQALERYLAPQVVDMVLETAPGRLSLP